MLPEQLDTMFSIRCDCTATGHLIYKMENGSAKLKKQFNSA